MSANKVVFRFVNISFTILVLLLVFIGVFKASAFCYEFGYRIFTEAPMAEAPGKDVIIRIEEGDSAFDISRKLEDYGLVSDSLLFTAQYYLSAYVNDLNPGTYTLNTSMTAKEMMLVMSAETEDTEEVENES